MTEKEKLLAGMQVAAGIGHMLFLSDANSEAVKGLEEFHPEVEIEDSKSEEEVAAETGKGTAKNLCPNTLRPVQQTFLAMPQVDVHSRN